ncbi:cytochrome c biogenesis heme-transporting ATPase CcmA [Providencia burhodogranariea]|uniref:Heme exporter protein CcmA n=1 Tax=Providencia burhodogranariea DSM 19968 TaxID=1141662 RepID=K8WDY4_9GAMM|nr:cytochrome c biogenesis heme-transporting ATPase CcmA [Providencia burhodogranariea]EKT54405.1 heme exporter protein CcmA [Providencia burhodogranariea DSM 19968]
MLSAEQISCQRQNRLLFQQLSFTVLPGQILQVEGANGAGKTTLLRMIAGLSKPDDGDILWQQQSIYQLKEDFTRDLLYLGHKPAVKSLLTPYENLQFYYQINNKHPADELIWSALEEVSLIGYEDIPVGQLSAGQQRRVNLARLWLSDAPLWVLDEPFTAIDVAGVNRLTECFHQHAQQGGIILFTSHQAMSGHFDSLKLTGGDE